MYEPGATMSGFILPSSTGPRLENALIPLMLSAALSSLIGLVGKSDGHIDPHWLVIVGRLFSLAPTVKTFFAVAGFPSESKSTSPFELASVPELPAENKIVIFL